VGNPVLHLLAGPNGAGKSTFFAELIGPATGLPFINADEIAARNWPGTEIEHSYEAADVAAFERQGAIERRDSFITETVFSHPSKVEMVRQAKDGGYHVTLHIVLIPEPLAVARVRNRVELGGHGVPEDKISGRFARLWGHLREAIMLADETFVYDNSLAAHPFRRVAAFSQGRLVGSADWPEWTPHELRDDGSG
jgi:predicted ABC-type ATPase